MARKPVSKSNRASAKPHAFGVASSKVVPIGQAGRQSLRIIAGQWRGRKIPFATVSGLRPTQDRVRETLFNWVADGISGARCLDLYAGTGALGLEALSRGAKQVDFVELSNVASSALNDNLKKLPIEQDQIAKVEQMSSFDWLRRYKNNSQAIGQAKPYNLVLLDPPFALALMQDTLTALFEAQCLAPKALIYVEQATALSELELPAGWTLYRSKKAGQVFYGLISC
jgi:16S rRNA (guanine966-N2)-methyltransferase